MTISHPPTHTPVRTTGDAAAAQAVGLADEHGQLLRQVAIRTDALLAAAASGGWPAEELHALLGYLSTEVLRQAADEEAFLFPVRAGWEPAGSRVITHGCGRESRPCNAPPTAVRWPFSPASPGTFSSSSNTTSPPRRPFWPARTGRDAPRDRGAGRTPA